MSEILESAVPFSQSKLWELQTKAYLNLGPKAWGTAVPSYITSNPFTARLYAGLSFAYLEDAKAKGVLDLSKPVYFFDLGAGSGRFAYLFLRAFDELVASSDLSSLNCRYLMTDISTENLIFWQKHPLLQSYFEKGVIEAVLYRHNALCIPKVSGLNLNEAQNPCILLANYFFDTIPQALYKVENEELYEGYAELSLPYLPQKEDCFKWIHDLECTFSFRRIEQFDKFLYFYGKKRRGRPFLFPEGAVMAINPFKEAFKGRCFLIAGDQGQREEKGDLPQIAKHGAFSVGVNYEVFSSYLQELGASVLEQKSMNPVFVNFAASLSGDIPLNKATSYFCRHFDNFSPTDQYLLVDELYSKADSLSFASLNALLKLSDFDPVNLYLLLPFLTKLSPSLTAFERKELLISLEKTMQHYYTVSSDEAHFVNDVGVLYFNLKAYRAALAFFNKALDLLPGESAFQKNKELATAALQET